MILVKVPWHSARHWIGTSGLSLRGPHHQRHGSQKACGRLNL